MSSRRNHLRLEYGISEQHYDWLLAAQGDVCAICRGSETHHRSGRFVVDHCHSTGKLRGLLCANCNIALGKLKDNSRIIMRAAGYVAGKNRRLVESMWAAGIPEAKPEPMIYRAERWAKKLTWEKVDEMRKLYANGKTQVELGERFGVSQMTVSKIILRQTWDESREGVPFDRSLKHWGNRARKVIKRSMHGGKKA